MIELIQLIQLIFDNVYVKSYIFGFFGMWFSLVFLSGINASHPTSSEFKRALIWPITICSYLGLVFGSMF